MKRLIVLALLLSGCTTVSVDAPPSADCLSYVPEDMLADTPHAPPPGTSQASHGDFELSEAGQLEKANSDKRGTKHIISTCETKYGEMVKAIQRKAKPWYKKIF